MWKPMLVVIVTCTLLAYSCEGRSYFGPTRSPTRTPMTQTVLPDWFWRAAQTTYPYYNRITDRRTTTPRTYNWLSSRRTWYHVPTYKPWVPPTYKPWVPPTVPDFNWNPDLTHYTVRPYHSSYNSYDDSYDTSASGGSIAGIVIGVILAVILKVGLWCCVLSRAQKRAQMRRQQLARARVVTVAARRTLIQVRTQRASGYSRMEEETPAVPRQFPTPPEYSSVTSGSTRDAAKDEGGAAPPPAYTPRVENSSSTPSGSTPAVSGPAPPYTPSVYSIRTTTYT